MFDIQFLSFLEEVGTKDPDIQLPLVTHGTVQFSCSVVSDSLWPHESQHARPPCPSLSPRVHSDSHPLSQWYHPPSHLILCRPLLLLPPIPPSITVFSNESTLPMRWPKYWVSALASFLPKNTQDWSPPNWTGWISLQSMGFSRVFSNTTVQKHQFFGTQFSSQSNSHPYMTTGKTIALTRRTFVGKVMSLLLNMLSRLVITFLPRSKCLLISWLQSPSAVILEPPK